MIPPCPSTTGAPQARLGSKRARRGLTASRKFDESRTSLRRPVLLVSRIYPRRSTTIAHEARVGSLRTISLELNVGAVQVPERLPAGVGASHG